MAPAVVHQRRRSIQDSRELLTMGLEMTEVADVPVKGPGQKLQDNPVDSIHGEVRGEVNVDRDLMKLKMDDSQEGCPAEDKDKHVSFSALHIREYDLVLGDHPCCSAGPPLSLGWDVVSNSSVSVDEYEAARKCRRTRTQMRLRVDERRSILTKKTSKVEVRRVERRVQRERMCSKRCSRAFFEPVVE